MSRFNFWIFLNPQGLKDFSQKNDRCIYLILSLYSLLYAPVHFVHYTSITGTNEERSRENDICNYIFRSIHKH